MAHLLLVEDEDALRGVLQMMLVQLGHQVVEARNGHEALRLYEQAPADLVITDLVMPEKEGLEIIRELRRKHPDVKIIAMSGGGRLNAAGYLKIARAMSADVVLEKPFSQEALRLAVEQLLGKSEADDDKGGRLRR